MNLEDIGFYTLTDKRAKESNYDSQLKRCELLLTGRCNFHCPYCRSVGGKDIALNEAKRIVDLWANDNLENIRFSGGEPTLWSELVELVKYSKSKNIQRVAISTNGSAEKILYENLLLAGVNDFSISLDACCSSDGDIMAGGIKGAWEKVVNNISWIAKETYVTVGVVLTQENEDKVSDIISLAQELKVSDIRIIPAAQYKDSISIVGSSEYPILKYRLQCIKEGKRIRGLYNNDSNKCGLCLDDMAVMQGYHWPCIIYLREGGNPIGFMTNDYRTQRKIWFDSHNSLEDPICKNQCLDFCATYNRKWDEFHAS